VCIFIERFNKIALFFWNILEKFIKSGAGAGLNSIIPANAAL
jgi:hypothetical protein